MTRLPLALVGLSFALVATIASAQSYPQSMYGPGPMQQASYGYGQMQPSPYGYGAMQAGGMNSGAMYAAAGYPMPAPVNYGPNAMQPGMYGQAAQASAQQQSPMPQQSAPQQPVPGAEYHGPQGGVAKANPPPAKLPRGVKSENGLLYYNGSPAAPSPDVNYQQFPMNRSSGSPVQMASYQAGAAGEGSNPQSVMNSGNAMQAGQAQGDGQCQNCNGNCDGNCDDGCCGWLGSPYKCLFSFCHGGMFPGKVGYVWQAGYVNLAMTRNAGSDRRLLVLDSGGTAFNSQDFDFNWDYGGKAHIELIGPSGITYQWAYTRIATFVTNESVLGLADLSVPGTGNVVNQPGFALADSANFYYASAIQTGEFNVIFPFGSFEIITGYRYMQVDETSKISMFTEGNPPASFVANSLNVMNGGQIGGMGRWEMFGLFDFDFDAKFAVMGDAARTQQNAVDNTGNPVTIDPVTGTKTRVAFVTELGAQLVMPIGPSWSAHCGYNVYFIDRVALAPDQFDFNLGGTDQAGTFVKNHGDIVLQGVNLGVTAVW
jgi:hypothetical protein